MYNFHRKIWRNLQGIFSPQTAEPTERTRQKKLTKGKFQGILIKTKEKAFPQPIHVIE